MGIFGGTATPTRSTERKKRPDDLLSSVVPETAIPAAVELLQANTPFVFPSGTAWVILTLDVATIGGLSRRHGRDEAKGSIIELIRSDQLQTVATAEMLAAETLGLIPTPATLERMSEYSLLTRTAAYTWSVVWQKPRGDLIVDQLPGRLAPASHALAAEVAAGRTSLREAVGARAWREHSGLTEDADPAPGDAPETGDTTEGDAAAGDGAPEAGDTEPDGAPADDFWDEPAADGSGDPPMAPLAAPAEPPAAGHAPGPRATDTGDAGGAEEPAGFPGAVEPLPADLLPAEEGGAEEADPAAARPLEDQQQVRAVIARRFLAEDLDLAIGLDEFDATFAIGAPAVQIEVPPEASAWLGDQVAQLTRQANAELAQLRAAHEDELRTLYVTLSAQLAEGIIRKVATDREGSRYQALKAGTDRAHADRIAAKDTQIRLRRAELLQAYEAEATRRGEQAALLAETQYRERNRPRLERDQAAVGTEVERLIEDGYTHDLQEILSVRRSDADLQLQVGRTAIFEVLADQQSDHLRAEADRLHQWVAEIRQLIGEHREADLTRAAVLAEQQRTTDALGAQHRDYEATLATVRAEHAERTRRLAEELDRTRTEAVSTLRAREAEWHYSLNLEVEKTRSQTQRNVELLEQLDTAETRAAARHAARLDEALADKDAFHHELVRASEMQGRSTRILIAFVIVMGLICLGAGFILGAGVAP
ncbi:hypothetical protein [Granulicoccus phenolivorans]|uniref:hypothetical protein n=1 Tax=Granulicoccus phenolivorans TaxID=266854 RepID=UPI00041AFE05|nr:hypothetical protein [Granulicoccus phenolivorans]